MASSLPTPVAAAIGIVPAVLDGVRRLPVKAVQLPILALSSALTTMDALRKEYDELAERGERLVARLRGEAVEFADEVGERADALEDRIEEVAGRAPFATAPSLVKDVGPATTPEAAESPATTPEAEPSPPAPTSEAATSEAATSEAKPAAELPKGVPTPKAVEPDGSRVDTAASPSVVRAVEEAAAATPTQALEHDELPLPDYDHMTLGSLRGRLRSLSVEQLVQVRAYEKGHADRLPVVTMLDNRIAKLSTSAAEPTGGLTAPAQPQ